MILYIIAASITKGVQKGTDNEHARLDPELVSADILKPSAECGRKNCRYSVKRLSASFDSFHIFTWYETTGFVTWYQYWGKSSFLFLQGVFPIRQGPLLTYKNVEKEQFPTNKVPRLLSPTKLNIMMAKHLMNMSVTLVIFVSSVAAFLGTPKGIDITAGNRWSLDSTKWSMRLLLWPLYTATANCENSADTFCGCDAWIKGRNYWACLASQNTTFVNPNPVFQEITRALCFCPNDCPLVADAAFKCGLHGDCLCSALKTEGNRCASCVKSNDDFAGLLFETFISSCSKEDEVSGEGILHWK